MIVKISVKMLIAQVAMTLMQPTTKGEILVPKVIMTSNQPTITLTKIGC